MREALKTFREDAFREEWKTDWIESGSLQEGIEYTFSSGGKRIRALFCLRLSDALDGNRTAAELFAHAIEAHHNLTLVHDDIMDGDVKRRGKEAVWKRHGLEYGILVGDALHALGYSYLTELSYHVEPGIFQRLLELYTDMSLEMADGQAMDLEFRDRDDVTQDEYVRMTRKKTGSLFITVMVGSAIIAGVDGELHEKMAEFARAIGPAFQIRDDVIDLIGEKGRDRKGEDVAEGKRSLVAVLALQRLGERERDELLHILDKPKDQTTGTDIDRAIALFQSAHAIEDANTTAERLVEDAAEALATVDQYDVGEIEEIADFLVERTF